MWFAGNAILPDLVQNFELKASSLGALTSSVQLGFIIGTLIFALLSIADRFSPSSVFFTCSLIGALFNLGVILDSNTIVRLLVFRFLTGFFLAGIYPVGMKIASDYYDKGLGKSLGYLVGALVVGTAFPHLLQTVKGTLTWEFVIIATSILSAAGGLLIFAGIPDGPYRTKSPSFRINEIGIVFKQAKFRKAAFGYFGHMWELYAFWAFVPVLLTSYQNYHNSVEFNTFLLSFIIIAVGGVACVAGGYMAQRWGVKK